MPRKINPNIKECEENYEHKGPIIQELCASCYWNLFAYCWVEDKDHPLVIRALQGSDTAKQELHLSLEEKRL